MSFSTIRIHRDLPIISGYVQVPPNRDQEKTKTTDAAAELAIPGAVVVRLSLGSGRMRGSKCGQQEFLRLPGIRPDGWYTTDPVAAID